MDLIKYYHYRVFQKDWYNFDFLSFFVFWPLPFSFSGFGGVIMIYVPWDFQLRSSTMPFTVKWKTKVVALWSETKSYIDSCRRFCREYDLRTRDGPTNCATQRIVKHFEHKRTVHNQSKGNSGRPASVTSMPCEILWSHRWRSWELGIKHHQFGVSSLRNWIFSHTSSLLGINWVKMTWEGDLICAIGSVAGWSGT